MEAAFAAFARHGIARTTMRDICSQAKLTDRYFYEVFAHTDEAFDAVYQWQIDQLIARISEAMVQAPPTLPQLAKAGLRAFYAFIQEDKRRAQVLLVDAFSASKRSAEQSRWALDQYVKLMTDLAHKLFPKLKPGFNLEMLVWGLLGMAIQVGTVWARADFQQSLDEVLDYNLYAWQGLDDWTTQMAQEAQQAPKANTHRP